MKTIKKDFKNLVDRSNLSIRTYKLIKNMILSKDIENKINLDNIAERLGVSRTPVIAALNKLESEGFLINIPYKGYSIKKHSEKEIKEIIEIRILFESLGVEKIINSFNEEDIEELKFFLNRFEKYLKSSNTGKYRELDILFHKFIVKKTQNDTIIKQYNNYIIIPALLTTYLNINESIKHHRNLINNILKRNTAEAKKIIHKHIGALV